MNDNEIPSILCVDDEPRVVEGLVAQLRKDYEIHTACSGEEGLSALKECGGVSVVVADMRMPGMDGATFLSFVRTYYPETTRILLTGEPSRDAAIAAVNEARVFRFLTKPCAPDKLRAAVQEGVIQHRLVLAERNILQETMIGCIKALSDVLAMANPIAFGRANRVKRLSMGLATTLEVHGFWQLEAAAMLSQVGYLSLAQPLLEKLYYGKPLDAAEELLAAAVPKKALQLLEHIPRLEPVIQILAAMSWDDTALARLGDGTVGLGARILGLVLEYDVLNTQGHAVDVAIQTLRRRAPRYTRQLIEQLGRALGAGATINEARQMPLKMVQPGMIIAQDIRTEMGTLLVPRGYEVTSVFMDRSRSFGTELLNEIITVMVPGPKAAY
jgi:response regulator RpfG family c-di-GMP phosphodiesterase